MSTYLTTVALFLLANILAGLWRVVRGPTAADRMLSANLFSTTGVGILLLLSAAEGQRAPRDVALVFAALAAVAVSTFVTRCRAPEEPTP